MRETIENLLCTVGARNVALVAFTMAVSFAYWLGGAA